MVVDDMAVVREPIAATLRGAGYKTICVADGKLALAVMQTTIPDLLLLDLSMPGLDGMAVLRAMRARPETANTPVIMLTASSQKGHVVEAASLGVKDYLLKSGFALSDLLARVGTYLPQASKASPAVGTPR
jgi:DNA-binding response OmpR family regulator